MGLQLFSVPAFFGHSTRRGHKLCGKGKAMLMKKRSAALLPLILGLGIMFTACGNNADTGANGQNGQNDQGTGSSASQRSSNGSTGMNGNGAGGTSPGNGEGSVIGDNNARTGDIDGDGFIEDVVTGAEDIVGGAVRGAEDIIDDITPGERDNATQTTTVAR